MNLVSTANTHGEEYIADIPGSPWLNPHLRSALQHSMQSRGGGFRAKLVTSLCRSCRLGKDTTVSLSSALEYFHLASLLLDDLPCMDDATTRRGLPCTHRVYGESMAILAALALINRAYFLVWDAFSGREAALQSEVNVLLDQCLGLEGILNGQALDLKFEMTDRGPGTIERIAMLKTGSLLRLSIMLPILAGVGQGPIMNKLRHLADTWGAIYQLLDDIKDVEWSESDSGKTPMRDALLDRPNLALSLGPAAAMDRLRQLLSEADALIEALPLQSGVASALEPVQHQLAVAGKTCLASCAA